jgi:PAS domain S-box-containing protein
VAHLSINFECFLISIFEQSSKRVSEAKINSIYNSPKSNQIIDSIFSENDETTFKQKFDVLFRTIPDGVVLIKDGVIIYSNNALANILGYKIDEVANLSITEVIAPNFLDLVLDKYGRRNRGEDVPSNYEVELISKDRQTHIPVALSIGLIESRKDKLEFVIVRDLTEKVDIETRAKRETELHNYFMDYLPDSIYFKDLDSKFINANNATLVKMGLKSLDELLGKTDYNIFSDEHAIIAKRDEENIIKNRTSIINKIEKEIWKDERVTWASTTKIPLIDENENVYGTFGITRDITELKKAQDINEALFKISSAVTSLNNINELYSSIHTSISELMRTDNFYLAIYHPETDTVSFPYFVDEVDENPGERKAARGLTEYVLRTGTAQLIDAELDFELRRKGETFLIGEPTQIWLGVPLKVEGKTIGALVVQDYSNPNTYGEEEKEILIYVSEQIALAIDKKRNEEKIIKYSEELKEINATKDKFFSIIAHDLKSPFHGLLGLIRMMAEDYESLTEQEIKQYLHVIRESSESTYKLIENLLEWSQIETGKIKYNPTLQNMFIIVEDTRTLLNQVSKLKNITVRNKLGHHSFVWGDDAMLQSLIQNLISNAIKFTPSGGSIVVTENQFENTIEYSIIDSGVGIKEEDLPKLFRVDVSFTTKGTQQEKGTGLGLVLCKEIIARHNGTIEVESKPGKGTKVTFSLQKPLNY